jgi:ferric-dicitrate binding protein FerR (iron transport regulator)
VTDCVCGCQWVEQVAQAWVGDLQSENVTYAVVDAFHDVRDTTPYHHAHLWNNCSLDEVHAGTCVLNVTTVTQLVYQK